MMMDQVVDLFRRLVQVSNIINLSNRLREINNNAPRQEVGFEIII